MQQRRRIGTGSYQEKPKILLLDEAFLVALDSRYSQRKAFELVIGALASVWPGTIFMVTHDFKRKASTSATRLWVFDKVRHDPHAPNLFGSHNHVYLSLHPKIKNVKQSSAIDFEKSTPNYKRVK